MWTILIISVLVEKDWIEMKNKLIKLLVIIAIMIMLLVILNKFIIINVFVSSDSMENTIQIGDKLIGSRIAVLFKEVERFDIVIVKDPLEKDRMLVKRIIGLPNEKLTIKTGKIYINDSKEPLQEQYLKEEWDENCDGYIYEIPDNSYLLLGDNRNDSLDSRDWDIMAKNKGLTYAEDYSYIPKEDIIAKVVLSYYPNIKLI